MIKSAYVHTNKKEHGIVVLLVTSTLLVVALIMSLSSYNTIFFQLKRAHNDIATRKAYWLAEGGLSCVFAQVSQQDGWALDELYRLTESGYFQEGCAFLTRTDGDNQALTIQIIPLVGTIYNVVVHARYNKANSRLRRSIEFNLNVNETAKIQAQENQPEQVLLYPKWVAGSWDAD